MSERQKDAYILEFVEFSFSQDPKLYVPAMRAHFRWAKANRISYEIAAPRGWMGGDPGSYIVYFDSSDDPRIAAYSAVFEHPDGKSLQPEIYQMHLYPYQVWLNRKPSVINEEWDLGESGFD